MNDIEPSKKKKLIIFASAGLVFWAVVAWLFLTVPIFVIDALPQMLPLSVFAFLLFLIGLLFLTVVGTTIVRSIAPRYAFLVIVGAAAIFVAYNSSPLAPSWSCYGKRLYVKYVKAASNCTTVCTNNDKKPCGGWSSCWDKYVSCSSSGIDQGGRPCQGCCFSCDVVCEEDPDPTPAYNPPTITASLNCPVPGDNGWCKANETITMTASDPQGFALTISGDIAGTPFTCAVGTSCTKSLPAGSGTVNYAVIAATSGLTTSGSTTWKLDTTYPTATISIPSPTGSNGWFKTLPVLVSVSGSDTYSGLAVARLSTDTVTWQPSSITFSSEGKYMVWYGADDLAGNRTDYSDQFVNIDTTPPNLTPSISGTMGANGMKQRFHKIDMLPPRSYNPYMARRLTSLISVALGCILITIGCTHTRKTTANASDTPVSIGSQLASGAPIYAQTCATSSCHGTQGEGIRSGDGFSAWPLVGNEFQSRHPNAQIVFDVVRSGGERNLLALTDQQIYDSIAYQLSQNQITLESPLTADNAFRTYGGSMSGSSQGGLYPPSNNAVITDPPMTRDLPIAVQNDRLRLQLDQIAQASAIGKTNGTFLILVIVLNDLNDQPITISPAHLRLATPGGELLKPQSINIQSAIEKLHTQTIKFEHGTVGLVVFNLSAPKDFDQLIYDDGTGVRVTLALNP